MEKEKAFDFYCAADTVTKNKILLIALDFMEQYNGRGKKECIILAVLELHLPVV